MLDDEVLDTELVSRLIDEKGLKRRWLVNEIGLARTTGLQMLRLGLLPKDRVKRTRALRKLSDVLGREPTQLVLRLERSRRKSA